VGHGFFFKVYYYYYYFILLFYIIIFLEDHLQMISPITYDKILKHTTKLISITGLGFVIFPNLTSKLFHELIGGGWFGEIPRLDLITKADNAQPYIGFVYSVLGCVLFGWGLSMHLCVTDEAFTIRREKKAWERVAIPLYSWFILDSGISIMRGYWQNTVLNLGFMIPLGIPLFLLRRYFI